MPHAELLVTVSLGLQAFGAVLAALFLSRFFRSHPKRYLNQWIRSWWTLAMFFAACAAHLSLPLLLPSLSGLRFLTALLIAASGFFQLGFLLLGSTELARQRPLKRRNSQRLLIVVTLCASVFASLSLVVPSTMRFQHFFWVGLHSFLAAGVLVGSGLIVWRLRGQGEASNFGVFALALGVHAATNLAIFAMAVQWSLSRVPILSPFIPLVLVAGELVAAVGMIIAVIEDDREAAVLAASAVEHLAYHDVLTGLPNRSLFFDRLRVAIAHAERHRQKVAVLFVDLDRFKHINDSLGHVAGDEVLKNSAVRIRNCVRSEDTVARFGGDEFAVLIPTIARLEDAGRIAMKILESQRVQCILGGREVVVTSSVGIALYPADGGDADSLVKNSDVAMYRAKEKGRDRHEFYTSSMNARALEMLEIEQGLRKALAQNELVIYYQPLIDVISGTIFGLEALLRWKHPTLGLLVPERFIGVAEASGLIIPIGDWVLREACRQGQIWQRTTGLDLVISINLSARQFEQPDLAEKVREALQLSGLPPEYLELEITETNAMKDVDKTIAILEEIKELGVRISIDDFGTGYSSLSCLKQFPLDTLKLDQSFVRDIAAPEDGAIATGVIAMAHSLSLKVIAEGVETLGQLEFLRRHSCDRLQGYLFSRPLSPEKFASFLANNKNIHVA